MSHIGMFTPASPGHMNPMSCLGRELLRRGHRVTYFQLRDCEQDVLRNGLDYVPIAEKDFPKGTVPTLYAELGECQGTAAIKYVVAWFGREARAVMAEAPDAVRRAAIDLMLVDQTTPGPAIVAEHLGIPLVLVSNALILNREPAVPPFFTPWAYSTNPIAQVRNRLAYAALDRLTAPYLDILNDQRRRWNLKPVGMDGSGAASAAHISQQPACFDFPRREMPANFSYTGPFHDVRVRPPCPFPWERLTGRRLIYASMGTLQNRLGHVFQAIAEACHGLDADVVISMGGGSAVEGAGKLPGDPIVVPFAPQLELLAKASLTITHAGMNTALETLAHGVPAVAIPVGNDQPGVAARLKWSGAGEFLPLSQLRADRLRGVVERVLTDARYGERARELQRGIQASGGLKQAADIVEAVQRNYAS
jgi:zeaxanthin glucosyltransferase